MLWKYNNCYEMNTIPQPVKISHYCTRIYLLLHNGVDDRDRYRLEIVVCANRRHQFREFSIHHSHLFVTVHISAIHIHKNWMRRRNKNSKITFRIFLRWIDSHWRKKEREIEGNEWRKFNENCFSTYDSSSSCIKHILRSLFTKKKCSRLPLISMYTKKERAWQRREISSWLWHWNALWEISVLSYENIIEKMYLRIPHRDAQSGFIKKGGWRIDGWLIYYARVLSNARHL